MNKIKSNFYMEQNIGFQKWIRKRENKRENR